MIVMEGVIYSLFLSEAQISLPLQILLWDAICIYIHTHTIGEGNGDPLQYSCLESSVDGGAWWAAIHRVAQSQTQLKWFSMHACIGEGNGSPLQYSCLENPRDRGAWWAAVYGIVQSQTWLKRFSNSSSSSAVHSLKCSLNDFWFGILIRCSLYKILHAF